MSMKLNLGVKESIAAIIVIGLALRLVLAPYTTMPYDMSFWSGVINGFNVGDGLYDSEYYWYTPTWGYILSFLTPLMNLFEVDVQGFFVPGIDGDAIYSVTSTITTPGFNTILKAPLILSDIVAASIVYYIIRRLTGDDRKAVAGFGLWFLCPLVIWTSAVQGQFDTISALGMLASFACLINQRYFFAGVAIVFATVTKLFPAILIPLMIGYAVSKADSRRCAVRNVISAVIGGLVCLAILLLPTALTGDVSDSLSFITNRVEDYGATDAGGFLSLSWNNIFVAMPVILIAVLLLTYWMARTKENNEEKLVVFSTLAICALFAWPNAPPAPQYILIMIPMLALIWSFGYNMKVPYIIASVLFTFSVVMWTGPASLYPLALGTDLIQPDTIASAITNYADGMMWACDKTQLFKCVPAILAILIVLWKKGVIKGINWRSHDEYVS